MRSFALRRPLAFVLFVVLLLQGFVVAGLLLARALDVPVVALDLPLLALNALVAAVLLSVLGWWRSAGFVAPRRWRDLRLMIVPVVLLLGPTLFMQPQLPTADRLVVLVVVVLLIGFQEEAIFRGIFLRTLAPRGALAAVVGSAVVFGLIHANSFLVGRDPLFVAAQIVASFLGAIGLGALWFRIGSIWPLVLVHALNDFLQFSATDGLAAGQVATYLPLLKVVISGAMAAYGLYLLRDELSKRTPAPDRLAAAGR